ncbi:MAG: hypothetical protein LBC96_03160 [Lachnospiraceae bacterium]|jgi:hypothetical protein|nr:hypothetical protein [Lachnospiraceae bacterium]
MKRKGGVLIILLFLIGCTITETEEGEQGVVPTMQLANNEDSSVNNRNEDEVSKEIIKRSRNEFIELKERRSYLVQNRRFNESIALEKEIGNEIDVHFIVRSKEYTPAASDMDFHRIERFVFAHNIGGYGYGIVIDKTYGRTYFTPHYAAVWALTKDMYFAEYIEQDMEGLINILEEVCIRDWETDYVGYNPGSGSDAWWIGALFDDGTIMRRSGSGSVDGRPPYKQLEVFLEYVYAMGVDIETRHYAEGGETPKQTRNVIRSHLERHRSK